MVTKAKDKPLFQFCIFETYVNEVLGLPKELQIDELTFQVGFSLKGVIQQVPLNLLQLGVTYMREPSVSMEAQGLLAGKRTHIKASAQEICKVLSLDYRHMGVRRMQVSYKDVTATFTAMTKQMEGAEGKTLRTKVLGLVVTEGTEESVKQILKLLGAKKVHCKYSVQPLRTVVCTT